MTPVRKSAIRMQANTSTMIPFSQLLGRQPHAVALSRPPAHAFFKPDDAAARHLRENRQRQAAAFRDFHPRGPRVAPREKPRLHAVEVALPRLRLLRAEVEAAVGNAARLLGSHGSLYKKPLLSRGTPR